MDELTIQDIEHIRDARHLFERYGNWRQARALDAIVRKLTGTPNEAEILAGRINEGEARG